MPKQPLTRYAKNSTTSTWSCRRKKIYLVPATTTRATSLVVAWVFQTWKIRHKALSPNLWIVSNHPRYSRLRRRNTMSRTAWTRILFLFARTWAQLVSARTRRALSTLSGTLIGPLTSLALVLTNSSQTSPALCEQAITQPAPLTLRHWKSGGSYKNEREKIENSVVRIAEKSNTKT